MTNHSISQSHTNRIYYFDVLRTIACMAVVLLHSSASFVVKDFGSFNFWVGNFFDTLTRVGVPIFVMLSGALMLDEHYQFTIKKLIKHILTIVLFFIFCSAVYSILFNLFIPIIKHNPVQLKSLFGSFIFGPYHLWFCFMIVGLYLLVPLLRLWVNKTNKKYIEYFLILSFLFTFLFPQIIRDGAYFIPSLSSLNKILNNINLKYVGGFTTYFILGWYLHNYDFKHNSIIYILGTFGALYSFFTTYVLSNLTNSPIQAYDNLSVNVLFQSIAVFVFVKQLFYEKNNKTKSVIPFTSKHSLGVYAIHVAFVSLCQKILPLISINNALLVITITFLVAFLLSLFISFIISKIPFLKKVV